jgi:hypothetical protein
MSHKLNKMIKVNRSKVPTLLSGTFCSYFSWLLSNETVAVQWVAWRGLAAHHMETSSAVHDISILRCTEERDLVAVCCADSVHLG